MCVLCVIVCSPVYVCTPCVCICVLQQSLVSKVSRRQRVDMTLVFLNINVRRAHLLEDSLEEVCECVGTHSSRFCVQTLTLIVHVLLLFV